MAIVNAFAVTTRVGGGQLSGPSGGPTAIGDVNTVNPLSAGDSVTLPAAMLGLQFEFTNISTHSANIFAAPQPNASIPTAAGAAGAAYDVINALSNATAYAIGAGLSTKFVCFVPGQWRTLPLVAQ